MFDVLKDLCTLCGTSGNEEKIREYILSAIKGFAEANVDASGNIIAFKKGKKTPEKKIMVDAHMDEVGIIVSSVTPDGFLKFATVGGIKTSTLLCRKVLFENGVTGVICLKPIHLVSNEEAKKIPSEESLYIDIGAENMKAAQEKIGIGTYGVLEGDFVAQGDCIKSKALDDRIGCAVLIDMLKSESEYDYYATFTVCEEIGTVGAATAAYTVSPDFSIVLEATTANDISGVSSDKEVCNLSGGAAISFMDRGTVYDKKMFDTAIKSGIPCQIKRAVAGGNNAAKIHLSKSGVRTLAISVPCRYIHTPASVVNVGDIKAARDLAVYMINEIGGGAL